MSEELRGYEFGWNCRTVQANERARGSWGPFVDCSRDQLLPGSRFAQNQHRGIGCGHSVHGFQYLPKRLGGADNLLKHQGVVELLAKSDVLVPCSLFISLPLVDVGSGSIPTYNASLLIAKGVVVNEEPSIQTVFPQSALLDLEWNACGES